MTRSGSTIRSAASRVASSLVAGALLWSCGGADQRDGAPAPAAFQTTGLDSSRADGTAQAAEDSTRAPRDSALIAYLANEGVMVVASGKTVLIDALFRDGVSGYETVNRSMREAMEQSIGAFGRVELVLASHHHPDHFDARAVLRHLRNDPVARFVSTRQAAALLQAASTGEAESTVMERVTGVWPEEGRDTVLSFDDIELRVLNLHHGRDFDPPVENLGFLVNLGGFKVLHVGDTEAGVEEFARYELAEEGVHVAFLPYWKLLDDEGEELLREIEADRVVAIHVPAAEAPSSWFGAAGTRAGLVSQLERTVPGVLVLDEPGETHRIGYWPGERP